MYENLDFESKFRAVTQNYYPPLNNKYIPRTPAAVLKSNPTEYRYVWLVFLKFLDPSSKLQITQVKARICALDEDKQFLSTRN